MGKPWVSTFFAYRAPATIAEFAALIIAPFDFEGVLSCKAYLKPSLAHTIMGGAQDPPQDTS
jgi:hypothetical protein